MNCDSRYPEDDMATTTKISKMLQAVKGYAQVTNRRPPPRPPLLYLMQMRAQLAPAEFPRHRLPVTTDMKAFATGPLPIKINHVKSHPPANSW